MTSTARRLNVPHNGQLPSSKASIINTSLPFVKAHLTPGPILGHSPHDDDHHDQEREDPPPSPSSSSTPDRDDNDGAEDEKGTIRKLMPPGEAQYEQDGTTPSYEQGEAALTSTNRSLCASAHFNRRTDKQAAQDDKELTPPSFDEEEGRYQQALSRLYTFVVETAENEKSSFRDTLPPFLKNEVEYKQDGVAPFKQ